MEKKIKYFLSENKTFVIENYNQAKPFSSFLPAIAGLSGKPLWAYYVNRGQCISCFGVNNKDNAIMEFNPANKAYRFTQREGFRTFMKIKKSGNVYHYEPFQSRPNDNNIIQKMRITSHDL
ncbi:MAG: cellobiose phosphorylase, partial [Oscillospiraceae bacterium]|nr:cellobiose phosphorylase [Oscillospiraceae bacterium]